MGDTTPQNVRGANGNQNDRPNGVSGLYRSAPPQDTEPVEAAAQQGRGRDAAPSLNRAGQGDDALRTSLRAAVRRAPVAEPPPVDRGRLVRILLLSLAVSVALAATGWWWVRGAPP